MEEGSLNRVYWVSFTLEATRMSNSIEKKLVWNTKPTRGSN